MNPTDITYDSFRDFQGACHANSLVHGFWEQRPSLGEKIALIHSELSELLETYRDGTALHLSEKTRETTREAEEMADVLIRLCDLAEARGVDLYRAAQAKHAYNLSRPRKHGKEF